MVTDKNAAVPVKTCKPPFTGLENWTNLSLRFYTLQLRFAPSGVEVPLWHSTRPFSATAFTSAGAWRRNTALACARLMEMEKRCRSSSCSSAAARPETWPRPDAIRFNTSAALGSQAPELSATMGMKSMPLLWHRGGRASPERMHKPPQVPHCPPGPQYPAAAAQ